MKRILIRDLLRKSIRLDHLIAKQSRNPTREIGKFRRILPPGERSKHDFTCLRDLIRYTIRLTSYGDPKDSPDMFNEGFRALRLLEDRVGFFEKTSDSQKPELINLDRNRTCFPSYPDSQSLPRHSWPSISSPERRIPRGYHSVVPNLSKQQSMDSRCWA